MDEDSETGSDTSKGTCCIGRLSVPSKGRFHGLISRLSLPCDCESFDPWLSLDLDNGYGRSPRMLIYAGEAGDRGSIKLAVLLGLPE